MIFVVILFAVLCGFISMAVDLGRVQLAKTQLLHAADAAARAAAASFATSGVTAAQDSAVTWAARNTADGDAVVVDPNNDVEFGSWDSTTHQFTAFSGSARSSATAIRVWCRRLSARGNPVPLKFGGIIRCPSVDVKACAVATCTVSGGGVVGINSVTLTGAAYVDAYDSSVAPYSAAGATSDGRVASNGDVSLANSSSIEGDAHPGTAGSVTTSGTAYVTGSKTPLAAALSYPAPTMPASGYTELGAVNLSGVAVLSLSAGTYHCTSLTTGNGSALKTTGAVTLYVDGAVSIGGASVVSVYQSRPANLRIVVLGSGGVSIGNGTNVTADIYAPLSDVTVANAGGLSGAAVGRTLTIANGGCIHYDESLGYGAAGALVVKTAG